MDFDQLLRGFLALIFVLGLIGGLTIVAKRFGFTPRITKPKSTSQRRLGILEVLPVDAKRKLILVKNDEREHLILLGAERDFLVDSDWSSLKKNGKQNLSQNSDEETKNLLLRRKF